MHPGKPTTSVHLLAIALGTGLCAGGAAAAQDTLTMVVPADLALHGPLTIGGKNVEWGDIVALRRTDATTYENGRCTFTYRYRVANVGKGAAGAHVNRLRLGEKPVLAENALPGLAAGQTRVQSGSFTLWSGEQVIYVELDAGQQVVDGDRSNNLRRIRADVAAGCADPRPKARPPIEPGSGSPVGPALPPTRKKEPAPAGSRAPAPEGKPAPASGTRAPVPQGKPAQPGKPAPSAPTSKPVPPDSGECKPMLSATRTAALTQTGARATAIAAWEASAFGMYGSGYRWNSSSDQSTECNFEVGWKCTVRARPCR